MLFTYPQHGVTVKHLPGGFKFLLFHALLGFPVCSLLLKYAPLFLQLFVLGFQVLLHLLMASLKLQGDKQDSGTHHTTGDPLESMDVQLASRDLSFPSINSRW